MKTRQWLIASSLLGGLFAGTAMAQTNLSSMVQQPGSVRQMVYQSVDYGYAGVDATPAPGAAAVPASPSNMPPAPPAVKGTEAMPAAEASKEVAAAEESPAEEGPVTLFRGPWLDERHLSIRGLIDVGYTVNPDYPINRYNGPVGYNDRANELDLNQLYLIAERLTKIENDCGVDYGYRADLLYGTDRRFVQVVDGSLWDSGWNNGNRFYGLSAPQFYGDLAINKLLLRGGHFYAPCGYEVPNADGNFFYSHTYGFLYGMPTTLTGGYGIYKLTDKLLVNAGFNSGWNEFNAINDKPNYMFGANWTSPDKDGRINIVSECFVGNTQIAGPGINDSTRFEVCTDINVKIGDNWRYVLENTVCHDTETPSTATPGGFGPASWIGWTNYLIYDINKCWAFGIRYEYFEDLDGAAVVENLDGSPFPTAVATPGSKWNDLTIGLNWKPNTNVTLRSEVRWDWADNTAAAGAKPFDSGFANGQFLWGNDVVIRF